MKQPLPIAFVISSLLFSARLEAQTAFSETREYRYPTRYEVIQPTRVSGGINGGIQSYPVVVPTDFVTRKVGAGVSASHIGVTGQVVVVNSADGAQLVTLRSSGGTTFRVTTGTNFQMNNQVFRAEGFAQNRYVVRNMANQQLYYFTPQSP